MIYIMITLLIVTSWFLPWWFLGVWGFLLGLIDARGSVSVFKAFVAGFATWLVMAFYFDGRSHGLIGMRLSELFHFPHRYLMSLTTGLLAGVISGFFAYAGSRISLRWPQKEKSSVSID